MTDNQNLIAKAVSALAESVGSIVDADDEQTEALNETFIQFQDYLTAKADHGDATAPRRFSQMFSTPKAAERALAHYLAVQERLRKGDESPEELEAARVAKLKSLNAIAVCQALADDQHAYGVTEAELVDLLSNHDRQPGESAARTFARHYEANTEEGALIRKAVEIARTAEAARYFDIEPVLVSDETDVNDPVDAIAQLKESGRQKWPEESEANQFERAFTDPANAELSAGAHRRPSATTVLCCGRRRGPLQLEDDDWAAAMRELQKIGDEKFPSLRPHQRFARAMEIRVDLTMRACKRPAPTTYFPYPR